MRFEQLEYVAAVTQFGSLRRASEHLHISQPALSEAIGKLEKELGVTLLDRRRSGARISVHGRKLLEHMSQVLEAVDRLKAAAGDEKAAATVIRLGTVNTATTQLLLPSLLKFQQTHPSTAVEVLDMLQTEIQVGLEEGTLDMGLANMLDGDDLPISIMGTPLLVGRPVVVLPVGHRYADLPAISVADLRSEPFILMRSGYLMHRLAHRLFDPDLPRSTRSTDGAEMGKLMVAEGLGLTILPNFSVVGDPLERAGAIVVRPIEDDRTRVTLNLLLRRATNPPERLRALATTLAAHARSWTSVNETAEETPA